MSTSAAILVPYQNLERLAAALNGLPDYPRASEGYGGAVHTPGPRFEMISGGGHFHQAPARLGVQLPDPAPRNSDPWAPIEDLFVALSETLRAEEEKRAELERQRAPHAHNFKEVRALRFGETHIMPPRAPSTRQRATDYLMRWIAEQWSPVVLRVVKRCELCSRWFVDRSKPHHAKRCAACRRRYWTRPRRRASLERTAHLGRGKRQRKRRR